MTHWNILKESVEFLCFLFVKSLFSSIYESCEDFILYQTWEDESCHSIIHNLIFWVFIIDILSIHRWYSEYSIIDIPSIHHWYSEYSSLIFWVFIIDILSIHSFIFWVFIIQNEYFIIFSEFFCAIFCFSRLIPIMHTWFDQISY